MISHPYFLYRELLGFFVQGMGFAETAILFHFDTIGRILFVLAGDIISSFALGAS